VEDTLKHLLQCERASTQATHESLAGVLGLPVKRVPDLVGSVEEAGLLAFHGRGFALTESGREYAIQILRAHRLWERYLIDEARYPLTRLHEAAERAEHHLSPVELDALEAHLGHPLRDPHGDPIPTAAGEIETLQAVPLTDWEPDTEAQIVHLEDEPPAVFEEIVASGLQIGQIVRVVGASGEGVRVERANRELVLAPVVAANVHVGAVERPSARPPGILALTELGEGVEAEVVAIDPAVRGFTRRRLMDLGVTPGVRVRAELTPPFGRPRAYRVRECLLALRDEQTDRIWVRPTDEAEAAAGAASSEAAGSARRGSDR
jgi:DtxR family Mn-dependent transcriptional regulator